MFYTLQENCKEPADNSLVDTPPTKKLPTELGFGSSPNNTPTAEGNLMRVGEAKPGINRAFRDW